MQCIKGNGTDRYDCVGNSPAKNKEAGIANKSKFQTGLCKLEKDSCITLREERACEKREKCDQNSINASKCEAGCRKKTVEKVAKVFTCEKVSNETKKNVSKKECGKLPHCKFGDDGVCHHKPVPNVTAKNTPKPKAGKKK